MASALVYIGVTPPKTNAAKVDKAATISRQNVSSKCRFIVFHVCTPQREATSHEYFPLAKVAFFVLLSNNTTRQCANSPIVNCVKTSRVSKAKYSQILDKKTFGYEKALKTLSW